MSQLSFLLNSLVIILISYYSEAFKQDVDCGVDEDPVTKINLGLNANPNDIPWIVNLRLTSSQDRPFCAGTIIDRQWILTAAHCFASQSMADVLLIDIPGEVLTSRSVYNKILVYVGDWKVLEKDKGETIHVVRQILIHSEYGIKGQITGSGNKVKSLITNDIALIKIEPMIEFSMAARPLCLPDKDVYGVDDVFVPKLCQIGGWGGSYEKAFMMQLQYEFIPILSPKICETTYKEQFNRTEMLCAGNISAGIDTCNGDSGGPLTCRGSDQRFSLYGIVSWGLKCTLDKKHSIGVYTRVGFYKDWITNCIDSLETSAFGNICISLLQTYENLKGKLIYGHPKPIIEPSSTNIIEIDVPLNSAVKKCSCDWRPLAISLKNYQTALQTVGKFINKCVSYNFKPITRADAVKECQTLESSLLTIKSLNELKNFTSLEGQRLPVWLALTYGSEQNKLRWDDGSEISSEMLDIVPSIVDSCYKLAKNNNRFVIVAEPCTSAVNFICESIESRFSPQVDILTNFNNLRRIKYCGSHSNQTYQESGQFNSIIVDSPSQNVFYGINPKLGQKKYQILEFDYDGEMKASLNVFYNRPQNNPPDIADAPITEFGGIDMTPNGKYFILSDTVQKGRKVSTIHKIGLNGDGITSVVLDSSAYYVIDVAVHSSGEIYLCNNRGRISIFKADPDLTFKREFGQMIEGGTTSDMIVYRDNSQYTCDSLKSYFTFTDTTYVNIAGDWVYILDQDWGNKQSRVHAFSILSLCPKSNQIPAVNGKIVRFSIEQLPLAASVQNVPNDEFIGGSGFGVNILAFAYPNSIIIYYHIRSSTRSEIQFVNRFTSQSFLFSYHSIALLKNHLLAAYDSSYQKEKIVLFDLV